MEYQKKHTSRIAGILILLGIIVGILSIIPSIERANFLETVYLNENQVFAGSLFQFLLVPIYIGFGLLLYPIVKQYNWTLSIGFVGFRFMAGTFQLFGIILLPLFVLISQKHASAISADMTIYESVGEALRLFRDLTNHVGVILSTGFGNLLLYVILYRGKLVPKWLSLWGFSGNLLLMAAGFFIVFQLMEVVSTEYALMSIPLVLQEITLAIWLLTKGLSEKRGHLLH